MAEETATFRLELEDDTSGASAAAAGSLESLKDKIFSTKNELKAMQSAMRNLKGGTTTNIQAFRELRDRIDAQKTVLSNAQAQFVNLGGSFERVKSSAGSAAGGFSDLTGAAQNLPGPLGTISSQMAGLRGAVAGGVLVGGLLAVAAAFAAVSVAAIAAAAAVLKYGVAQAGARRNERLSLEGLVRIRNMYGIAGGSAQFLQDQIDRVSGSVALGRDGVAQYARELHRAGLRGGNLQKALEGISIVASTQGPGEAARFKAMALGIGLAGGSIKQLTDDVKARLGGIAQAQMLSLSTQATKLKEDLATLFNDIKLDGFLKALRSVTSLFSQNQATGRALKTILETLFSPLSQQAESAAPLIKRFFQGITIGALQITIVLLKVRNWFKRTFGDSSLFKGFDAQSVSVKAGTAALIVFAGALGLTAAAMGAVALAAATLAAPFVALGAGAVIAFNFLRNLDWKGLGKSLIDGLVSGIANGARRLKEAVKSLAKGAKETFKGVLGIASPSRVFRASGLEIARGAEVGVMQGAPAVQRAAANLVDPDTTLPVPVISLPAGGDKQRAASQRPAVTVDVGGITIHVPEGTKQDMMRSIAESLETKFEEIAIQLGAEAVA
jgi:hypothetical protein